jgi:hypothetical protein
MADCSWEDTQSAAAYLHPKTNEAVFSYDSPALVAEAEKHRRSFSQPEPQSPSRRRSLIYEHRSRAAGHRQRSPAARRASGGGCARVAAALNSRLRL